MAELTCERCGKHREGLPAPPFNNDLGRKVHAGICSVCWADWLRHQTALINHYALNVLDPKAKTFLYQQLEEFAFGQPPETPTADRA